MATVTTTSAPPGLPQSWIGPRSTRAGVGALSPIGKIIFADTFTVALKDAANESEVIMTATLPPGYFYRPSMLWVTARGTSENAFNGTNGFELGMGGFFTENGLSVFEYPILNSITMGAVGLDSGVLPAFAALKTADDAVTNDFQAWYEAHHPIEQFLINASQGTSQSRITWMDTSTDGTAAVQIRWRLEMMRFTIEQGLSYLVNEPRLQYRASF